MSTEELITIDPQELKFPFELKKQISTSFQLLNKTDNHVAFKVKTTDTKKYAVCPNNGAVLPHSTITVVVTMRAQREAPPEMQCRDRFLVQSVVVPPGSAPKDITPQMFSKETGNHVEECKLRVAYVSPPQLGMGMGMGMGMGGGNRRDSWIRMWSILCCYRKGFEHSSGDGGEIVYGGGRFKQVNYTCLNKG